MTLKNQPIMDNKLPELFKTLWIEALRSGKYPQGRGQLKDLSGNYCCLGVAVEVGGGEPREWGYIQPSMVDTDFPQMLIGGRGVAYNLSMMNDSKKSFGEIADYIEKEL